MSRHNFIDSGTQNKINGLSHRSRGKDPSEATQRVGWHFQGNFKLRAGNLAIPQVTFDVPGSAVQLAGTYDLLGQALSFKGQLLMDAKNSRKRPQVGRG